MADQIQDLDKQIQQLQARKQSLLDEIEKIDAVFEKWGIQVGQVKRRGRKPGKPGRKPGPKPGAKAGKAAAKKAKAGKKAKRQKFDVPGHEAVVGWIKASGKGGAKTAVLAEKWKKDGRKGAVNTILNRLAHEGKVKRQNLKGQRGSIFKLA